MQVAVFVGDFPDCEYRNCVHLYARWDASVLVYLLPISADSDPVWDTQVAYEIWRSYAEEQMLLNRSELVAWEAWLVWKRKTLVSTVACVVADVLSVLGAYAQCAITYCGLKLKLVKRPGTS